ncbi:pyrroline-5-carboxylate reductase [uncultured Desulfovibrio sp.]|uniref:pyrroline-5-carboxylate reductase n=1 Tax=uncultured Desulfovibrio sp. TaxID=167968 RepID=UPI00261974C7|nr:pyrroline-5-carboxylate reductase [uncultured Desulfovibrio sp.]
MKKQIGCIGCGNMGGAIMAGLARREALWEGWGLAAFSRTAARLAPLTELGVVACSSGAEVAAQSRYIVVAVKPYQMDAVLRELAPHLTADHVIISVAAGVGMAALRESVGRVCPVVRCMPNTPAKVGKGVFGLCFDDPSLTDEARRDIHALFAALGVCVELPETRFTAFSALIGAGPAYVFAMMQGLVQAGATLGFTWAQSREMVAALFEGSALMAAREASPLMQLRDDVCSPGGLTIAGVNALDRAGLAGLLVDAVLAADARGREMEQ